MQIRENGKGNIQHRGSQDRSVSLDSGELGNLTVVLTPDHTSRLLALLSKQVNPAALAGLHALFPKSGDGLVATPEVRARIKNYVLDNMNGEP